LERNLGGTTFEAMTTSDSAPTFTARQVEVVRLIAFGCSNDEVGKRLGISPRTAKAHADTLRQKLGVPRRRQIPAAYRVLTGDDPLSESLEPAGLEG
jgi:LuxR family maltose regulon positive regulatory protein